MLFHVSYDVSKDIKEFIPRIPVDRAEDEESLTPRICVAPTIEGCLTAIPSACNLIKDTRVRFLFKVYEIEDVKPRNLLSNRWVKRFVPDAKHTGERWIVRQKAVPSKSYLALMKKAHLGTEPIYDSTGEWDEDVLVCRKMEYERSKEDYDRTFLYKIDSVEDLCEIKKIASSLGLSILEEGLLENEVFCFARISVPANIDVAELWIKYNEMRCRYAEIYGVMDYEILDEVA